MAADTSWRDQALCAEVDPEIFFPDQGSSPRDAKQICRACTVPVECLEYALDRGLLGVWGGTTEQERRRMRRAAGAA